jgi:hypothetical protein
MCEQPTLWDIPNVTSSPGLADGPTRSVSLVGPTKLTPGPDHVLVSRFRSLDSEKAMSTNVTSGPLFSASSQSADLQSSLESRLRARTDVNGSPEYVLTWKTWDMPAGLPICALRASARHTSGHEFIGWPTPTVPNGGRSPKGGMSLTGLTEDGKKRQVDTQFIVRMVLRGWPTPDTMDGPHGARGVSSNPKHQSAKSVDAIVKGWATPQANDWKGPNNSGMNTTSAHGLATQAGGALNPEFVCWLMGFPTEWDACAPMATRSSRKLQRNS